MEKINKLKKIFKEKKINGYLIPKNDEFFGEYILEKKDRLKYISNFSGSYGFALILNNKNYLFVDGRYTLQAKKQSENFFTIKTIPKSLPGKIFKNRELKIGFDPKLFTKNTLHLFFGKNNFKLTPINQNLIDQIWLSTRKYKTGSFFTLPLPSNSMPCIFFTSCIVGAMPLLIVTCPSPKTFSFCLTNFQIIPVGSSFTTPTLSIAF